jgi:dethiobiotin synthetase
VEARGKSMRGVVVAGIGTEIGKTLVAAVLCEVLEADYWKPVASGSEDGPTDDKRVAELLSGGVSRILPTPYSFTKSFSPHIAAAMDSDQIELAKLTLPAHTRPIVVELAGGVAVPLNDSHTNLDLIEQLNLPVVVVSRHYLGSINHTLLTVQALRSRNARIAGIVFNGEELPDSERIIVKLSSVPVIGRIPQLKEVNSVAVMTLANSFESVGI